MYFSTKSIQRLVSEKEIIIDPFDPKNLKGCSYVFTLGSRIRVLKSAESLDARMDPDFDEFEMDEKGYELRPGQFAIFFTQEKVTLNGKFICLLSTRSTIAQMGLDVSQSSFLAEPDTDNPFALEISNNGNISVRLYPGIRIVKGIFTSLQ